MFGIVQGDDGVIYGQHTADEIAERFRHHGLELKELVVDRDWFDFCKIAYNARDRVAVVNATDMREKALAQPPDKIDDSIAGVETSLEVTVRQFAELQWRCEFK